MQLRYDDETERFRAEMIEWMEANLPSAEAQARERPRSSAHLPDWARAWQRRLFDGGWLVPGWPPELGGRDATPLQQLVYFEEMARLPAQRSYNIQGLTIIAPSIRDHGSEAQAEQYVLPTLRAELSWCLGMSEPGAGSDLAALSTRAVLDGEEFVVDGQKVWTSGAADADYCFCFVRTDPEAPKHRGISVLVIDMRADGVQVRPLPEITHPDAADFSEVFFDAVRVPRANLVGALNRGWSISAGSLAHERGMLWTSQSARLDSRLEALVALGGEPAPGGGRLGDDAHFRDQVAALYCDVQALKFMGYRGFAKFARGQASPEHSLLKLLGSEVDQQLCLIATEALGAAALDVSDDGGWFGPAAQEPRWAHNYLRSFSNTIAGGTSEIQRNIIAQRVIGMPRG